MTGKKPRKKAWRAIWIFYFLIAFEIVYMISPFAVYYYSVYGKGLNFLNNSPVTSWLTSFFLPHIAQTSVFIFNVYKDAGWALAIAGFTAFCIGAGQIYYSKFAKKQTVTGGIYNYVRHPQYVSLSICSFGLLLVWPRHIVLIMFISMLFAYYFLAKAEEKECEEKFGESYIEYKKRTQMFLPFSIPFSKSPVLPERGVQRLSATLIVYLIVVASSIGMANLLKNYSVSSLYASYSGNSAAISLGKIDKESFDKIIEIALKDNEVRKRLAGAGDASTTEFLNYVLPSGWYFPDIPMNDRENRGEHYSPGNYGKNLYRILFMRAIVKPSSTHPEGSALIRNTVKRNPVVEVEVSLQENKVLRIDNPPPLVRWGDIPTPLF